jgi:protein required for attachment to host cells
MKRILTWILIADGARARIVLNDGPGRGVKPGPDQEFEGDNAPSREIGSDRPGRTFDSSGLGGRHSMEPRTDPHQHEQRTFHHRIAAYLDGAAKRGEFDRLILVAAPKALGNLRTELTAATRKKVTGELNKDLTHVPIHELASHLGSVLAV